MHTIKITPNLLIEYQCTSGKFIRLPNRIEKIDSVAKIESKLFFARIGMLYRGLSLRVHPQQHFPWFSARRIYSVFSLFCYRCGLELCSIVNAHRHARGSCIEYSLAWAAIFHQSRAGHIPTFVVLVLFAFSFSLPFVVFTSPKSS